MGCPMFFWPELIFLGDGVLKTLAGAEFWQLGSSNTDLFARTWVAAFASLAVGNGKGTKTNQTHFIPFFQGLGDGVEYAISCASSISLGQTSGGRDVGYEIVLVHFAVLILQLTTQSTG